MLIVGTGAVATLLASRLATLGEELQIFGSPSVRLSALAEKFSHIPTVTCVSDVTRIKAHNRWFVALKCFQNESRIRTLKEAPTPTSILVLQNGLRPEESWSKLCPTPVERGLCTYGVRSLAPGRIVGGESGWIGLPPASVFQEPLVRAGFAYRVQSDPALAVWQKLAVNASLNVVATVHNLTNGEVILDRRTREMTASAAREVEEVAQACGVSWGEVSAWELTRRVACQTSENICSTLADFRNDRPTEYDFINGEVLRRAAERRVATPTLTELDRQFRRIKRERVHIG